MKQILKEIGLTDSEINVYLALLDLGDSTRGNIVNKSGIAGSKVYEILERLQAKGLVSIYLQKKIKHFKPTNPKNILSYLEEKKIAIQQMETEAAGILPMLLAKFDSSKEEQEVELLTGLKGMELVFKEQVERMNKGETAYVIGGTRAQEKPEVIAYFEKLHRMRKAKGLITKLLYNESERGKLDRRYKELGFKDTTIRFLPHVSPVAINIYQDRTFVIIFGKQISTINIKSQDVANSFMEYFNILWKQSKA